MSKYKIVDLFSGAGGFQIGFERQGYQVMLSTDFDEDCEKKAEKPSREILKNQIRTLSFCEIGRRYAVSDNTIRKWCKGFDLPFKKSEIANYTDEDWSNI